MLNGLYSTFAHTCSNSAVAVSDRIVEIELACKEKNLFIVKCQSMDSLKYKSLQIFKMQIF